MIGILSYDDVGVGVGVGVGGSQPEGPDHFLIGFEPLNSDIELKFNF